jgi:deoxyribodipyrimidine photo-lyase
VDSRIRKLWPAGHAIAVSRLNEFLSHKISDYAATHSNPALGSTFRLSAYLSTGVLSVRELMSVVLAQNADSADFSPSGSSAGVACWVREIVFRELYRQTTVTTLHTAMNMPQNLKFESVHWERNEEG